MDIKFTLKDIERIIPGGAIEGGALSFEISRIATLSDASEGDLSFLSNKKYAPKVPESKASLILLPKDYQGQPNPGQLFMRVENPSFALAQICREVESKLRPKPQPGIHPTAFVDPSSKIDPSASIGPFVCVGKQAHIGPNVILESHVHIGNHVSIDEDSHLMPHVVVMDYCKIAKRVRLHPHVVIGGDGFGFTTLKDGSHKREPQIGIVVVEDDADIGSGTTIDRARINITRIGAGTKIDNLVQIAHNVEIGKNCLIVSQTGIAGSTKLGNNVVVGGQVGIVGHVEIGDRAMIGSQSGINHNVEPGAYIRGSPAYPYMFAQRLEILKKNLPDLFKRVDNLEEELNALKVEAEV